MALKACWVVVEKLRDVAEVKRSLTAKRTPEADLEPPRKRPRLSIVLARDSNDTWRIVQKAQREEDCSWTEDFSSTDSSSTSSSDSDTSTSSISEEDLEVWYGVKMKKNQPDIDQAVKPNVYLDKSTMKRPAAMDKRTKLASKYDIKNSSDIINVLFGRSCSSYKRASSVQSSSGIKEEDLEVRYGVKVKVNQPDIDQAVKPNVYLDKSTMKRPAAMDKRTKLASKYDIKNSSDIINVLFSRSSSNYQQASSVQSSSGSIHGFITAIINMDLKACWVVVENMNNVAEAKRNLTAK
ncbi:hypothetical protein TSAR_009464 [Trichomalopsis sarcophagae]|uniref:Uncharacterized protein n=1 Tax=Trichomalopsis sarcophagae TaxID=543379 RepID=A0A232FM19_9HYME|nr:hypothetical protein TSAR_009464 [Trichomalopsis sarcophagae]